MLQGSRTSVKMGITNPHAVRLFMEFLITVNGRMTRRGAILVKLILRDKEYEVKPGMTLLSSLQKINVLHESVIAARHDELILEDEILKDGDVVKLIAVISG